MSIRGEHFTMTFIEPGYNSDVIADGKKYHVQTEDWGESNPVVVTRVFCSGTVIVSRKTSYEEIYKKSSSVGRQAIRLGMREQHQRVLDQLVNGSLESPGLR